MTQPRGVASPNRISAAIFLGVTALLLAVHGQRMVLTNDEGIVLESAQRMAAGARLYVDFFGYMSPGSYWLQALVFRLLGVSLWTGRLIVILDFALQCALVYWLTARLASTRAAVATVVAFAGFQIADPAFLTSTHRWDSATLALASLCIAVSARRVAQWIASGAVIAAAMWCTPSMAIVAAVMCVWMAGSPERRGKLIPFLSGAAAVGLLGVAALAATGSLGAFFRQMAWLQQNYSAVNVLPYGSIIGGYGNLLEGSSGALDLLARAMLVACLALPAILPPAAILLGGFLLWRGLVPSSQRPELYLLLPAAAALAVTAFPRADVQHLAFVAALSYALAGAALAKLLPVRGGVLLALGTMTLGAVFASNYFRGWQDTTRVSSAAGILRVARDQSPAMEHLVSVVRPGSGLFVYPYMPVQYFLTQARNPTRFSYLAPGMMTHAEEMETLAELVARPPEWLLYLRLSREEFVRVFPHGERLNWRFEALEDWIERNYRLVEDPPVDIGGYRLWRRVPPPQLAAN